jgi:hypothetical protein
MDGQSDVLLACVPSEATDAMKIVLGPSAATVGVGDASNKVKTTKEKTAANDRTFMVVSLFFLLPPDLRAAPPKSVKRT